MTTAAELLAQTDCADLRAANESLQRQNDILTGRCSRLNTLLEERGKAIDKYAAENARQAAEIARLVAELAALNETCDRIARAGMREIDARDLGY